MKLTNVLRAAFVAKALDDVPQVDYLEQMRSRVNLLCNEALARAGIPVKEKHRLNHGTIFFRKKGVPPEFWQRITASFTVTGLTEEEQIAVNRDPQLNEMWDAHLKQKAKLNELRQKLRAAAVACTTTQKLLELLPAFEKYIPKEETKTKQLPAVTGLTKAFKDAGWPATKTQPQAAA